QTCALPILNDIEALADRVILIGKGNLLYDGKLNELRKKYGSNKMMTVDFRGTGQFHNIYGTEVISQSSERAILSIDTEKTMISRSEEHTSELQSRENLVCRLLLEKKKDKI